MLRHRLRRGRLASDPAALRTRPVRFFSSLLMEVRNGSEENGKESSLEEKVLEEGEGGAGEGPRGSKNCDVELGLARIHRERRREEPRLVPGCSGVRS